MVAHTNTKTNMVVVSVAALCFLVAMNVKLVDGQPVVVGPAEAKIANQQAEEAKATAEAKQRRLQTKNLYKKKRLGLKHPLGTNLKPLHSIYPKKSQQQHRNNNPLQQSKKNQYQEQTHSSSMTVNALGIELNPDGSPSGTGDAEIIGGSDTTFAAHPYFVDLIVCGGSLIHKDIVLTAASCSPQQEPLDVAFVGSDGATLANVISGTQHPNYILNQTQGNFELNYDFLILKLDQDVTTTEIGGQTIQLVQDDSNLEMGDFFTLVGLGTTQDSADAPPASVLQQVPLPWVPNEICRFALGEYVTNQQICAGGLDTGMSEQAGSCLGDGGAPLFRNNQQYGVMSWFTGGCGEEDYPDVFARVSSVYQWIQDMICCLSDSPPSTCGTIDPSQCPNTLTAPPTVPPTLGPTAAPLVCNSPDEALFKLDLVTDIYGDETGWELIDTCTNTELQRRQFGNYPSSTNTRDVQQICLPASSQYEFTIFDSYEDGIFAPGYYSLEYDGQPIRTNSGQDFETSQTTTFGSAANNCPPTPAPTPAPLITCTEDGFVPLAIQLLTDDYPQEISWDLTNECTDEVIARNDGRDYDAATTYSDQVCINPNERHTFKIRDDEGDGICCTYGDGEYTITLNGAVIKTGGEYGSLDSHTFGPPCGPTSAPTNFPAFDCGADKTLLQLTIHTDFYPQEITWSIENECNASIVKAGGGYDDELSNYVENICLENMNQFTFSIYDFAADGICCRYGEGRYTLRWNGEIIKTGDGEYGYGEATTFGSCALGFLRAPPSELLPTQSPSVVPPNPLLMMGRKGPEEP